ncbi:uncharacterized protein KY384_008515 [Bacidia gigantensis]|uniref:uncharacterized protein n=1 Tax=Bacidia gigantensis TaxID=2732470 RepID=UPI001D04A349|nr:uncharacterized protein KY384_008515 [Bacidia gigantensis]KAG8527086.1 hypothetical protein KY384_008515 [Bacidia gigantensis]
MTGYGEQNGCHLAMEPAVTTPHNRPQAMLEPNRERLQTESLANGHLAGSDESSISAESPTEKVANIVPNGEAVDPSHPSDLEAAPDMEKKQEEPPPRSTLKIALIMLSLCIAVFLAALDTTIITTAVPTIAQRFRVSEGDYAWIGSSYLLSAAASVPTWGKFSDIWGRKPVLLLANLIFLVASLIAALSINIKMLLAGRIIQVPFDGIAFAIILFYLDIETPKTNWIAGLKAIDWIGVLTISGGTVMFLLGLEYGGVNYPWKSATVICLLVFGIATVALFFTNEWKLARYPVMPIRLFKSRSNIACLIVCFIHGMVFIAGAYYLPLYFQTVLGASPILSGVYLFPFVLSLSFTSVAGGIFIKKTGQYLPPIWFGMIFMAIGFGLFVDLPSTRDWSRLITFQIIAGLGVGPIFQGPLIALQTHVEPRDIATATSLFGFTRNIATSISVVIGGVIFQNRMIAQQARLRSTLPADVALRLGSGNAASSADVVRALPDAQRRVVDVVYTDSLQKIWIFYVAIAVVGVLASFAIQKKTLSKQHEVYRSGLEQEKKNRLEQKQQDALKREEKEERRRSRLSQDLTNTAEKGERRKSRDSRSRRDENRATRRSGELHPVVSVVPEGGGEAGDK